MFVLYGSRTQLVLGIYSPPVLQRFDPNKNKWEEKATTCHPHFGSSLFVVNSKLLLAGGFLSITTDGRPYGSPAPVEMYNEETNTWSVVEQKHIPANNLNAVEIEGRVYFIINKFPIDSGIRIPPGELYPVPLGEWENLGNIDKSAALCYLPLKREFLKTDWGYSFTLDIWKELKDKEQWMSRDEQLLYPNKRVQKTSWFVFICSFQWFNFKTVSIMLVSKHKSKSESEP